MCSFKEIIFKNSYDYVGNNYVFLMFLFSYLKMDPSIWSLLPLEFLEMILIWMPFLTLVHFQSISKHCEELLSMPFFVSAWKNNNITDTGILIQLLGQYQNHFAYNFINRIGHTSLLHVPYSEYRYTIECTVGSIILLSKYCPL